MRRWADGDGKEAAPRANVSAFDMRGLGGTIPSGNVSRKPTWHAACNVTAACISSTTASLNFTVCMPYVSCLDAAKFPGETSQ